ncbi:type III-B CRISPR module RAMP protein Cmr6 [Phormidium sp. FACHB-322]|nr:type III-B CRISPR module RAMP protein Cmr6 [Phormidium sp. FACHB-77]MBD2031213.1 type III-B CRISPR module RAMP protein Cmr6 [Phormidium sp. FACHB-322]MBD2049612.1 type III-B CRISPR module RAMP protein Cmr6 [Leptolyngbya sp. FACHB-60]
MTGKPSLATSNPSPKEQSGKPKKVITVGVNRGNSGDNRGHGGNGGGGHNGGNGDVPSPWLQHPLDPNPDPTPEASFVEHLRWMRSYRKDDPNKDSTKVQILQMAEKNANYRDRLKTLTDRTRLIAGEDNTFQVKCLWRIRVGGHRGPENILLPAFDALGMPFIPASTLRGVARSQAIRDNLPNALDYSDREAVKKAWQDAEQQAAKYFGHLDAEGKDRMGKVVFLDAYPLPQHSGNGCGLAVDIATAIWKWDGDTPIYGNPNPNPFFSLEKATFLIGIRPSTNGNPETLEKVKQWLSRGLASGIGSQVNTGYGSLVRAGQSTAVDEFFSVNFALEGQLIHGCQKFTQWNWNDRRNEWQMRGNPEPEVRPVAFKSILRYWFRAFALGVLPSTEVQRLERELFGAISPKQARGKVAVRIADGRVVQREARPTRQGQNDPCGEQSGRLILAYSSETSVSQKRDIEVLFKNLTWVMFHLGGIGQGARRPCYSRKNRERAPWWRGSTLIPDVRDPFWNLPSKVNNFQGLFQRRLQDFYEALGRLADHPVNPRQLLEVGQVRSDRWTEAVDRHCRIIVCNGQEDFGKPYALRILHHRDFKRGQDYDGNLCGQVQGGVKPSPVWIADLDKYQVVTVFGATQDPRQRYASELRRQTDPNDYAQIWPLQ